VQQEAAIGEKKLKKKYGETFSGVIRVIEQNQYFR